MGIFPFHIYYDTPVPRGETDLETGTTYIREGGHTDEERTDYSIVKPGGNACSAALTVPIVRDADTRRVYVP